MVTIGKELKKRQVKEKSKVGKDRKGVGTESWEWLGNRKYERKSKKIKEKKTENT